MIHALGPRLTKKDIALAKQAAHSLELQARDLPLAAAAYAEFASLAAASADAEAVRSARFLKGAARRLKLLNQPLTLKGVTVAGQALDWKSYRGKVVLVSFVDTTTFASQVEWRAYLKPLYDRHKDQGFEVLGVSLNKDRQSLDRFLQAEKIPWTCLHDVPAADGGPSPLAESLGIATDLLPLNVLVDRRGKVLSTTMNGPALMAMLPRYVGRPPAPPVGAPRGQPFPPGSGAFRTAQRQAFSGQGRIWGVAIWVFVLLVSAGAFLVLLPFALVLAFQAVKRGYNGGTWCLAGLLSFNPMFPLVVLAVLPHRARQARRLKETQALQDKLAAARSPVGPPVPGPASPPATPLAVPSPARSTADFPARSLGDEVTRDLPAVSLGDEITRV